MRIGVVTTSYPRFPGDPAGNFVYELTQWIVACGHKVEVIAAGADQVADDWQPTPVVRVPDPLGLFYHGGAPDAIDSFRGKVAAARFSASLLRILATKVSHYDGIVAHWLAPSAIASVLAAPSLPIWAIAHGGDVPLLKTTRLSGLVAYMLSRENVHLNFVSRHGQELFFANRRGRRMRNMQNRSSRYPMGVDLSVDRMEPRGEHLSGRPLVLFVGRLVPIKGVDVLLDALSGLERDCEIVIAGDGPARAALQTQADKLGLTVDWKGEVTTSARDELLSQADLVVVPSREFRGRQEGMPLVTLEALRHGAELLVTDTGGLSEIPESICHRVAPENPVVLRKAIQQILDGEKARCRAGHWLQKRSWAWLAPRILRGMTPVHK